MPKCSRSEFVVLGISGRLAELESVALTEIFTAVSFEVHSLGCPHKERLTKMHSLVTYKSSGTQYKLKS